MNNSIKKSLFPRPLAAIISGLVLVNAASVFAEDSSTSGTINQTTPNTATQQDRNINQPNSFGSDSSSIGQERDKSNRSGDSMSTQNRSVDSTNQNRTGDSTGDSGITGNRQSGTTSDAQSSGLASGGAQAGQTIEINTGEGQTRPISANLLLDKKIVNSNSKKIGEVESVVQSQDGSSPALVVEAGGFLGLGQKEIVIPLDEIRLSGDQLIWDTQLDVSQIKKSEQYQYEERLYSNIADD